MADILTTVASSRVDAPTTAPNSEAMPLSEQIGDPWSTPGIRNTTMFRIMVSAAVIGE